MAPTTQTRPSHNGDGQNGPKQTTELSVKPEVAMTANGFTPRNIDEAWRYATALANSQFVPQQYANKPSDCLIAIDISMRLGVHPLAFLQNSYVVHGKPGMEAKLVISLINKSELFADPLEYEISGDDPSRQDYAVRAFAKRKSTGKVLYGPWITWKIVSAEGWDKKAGSKWLTIPALMFIYRAASWFASLHCPEIKMGMDTVDELQDIGARKQIGSRTLAPTEGRQPFGFTGKTAPGAGESDVMPTETPAPSVESEDPTPEPAGTGREVESSELEAATNIQTSTETANSVEPSAGDAEKQVELAMLCVQIRDAGKTVVADGDGKMRLAKPTRDADMGQLSFDICEALSGRRNPTELSGEQLDAALEKAKKAVAALPKKAAATGKLMYRCKDADCESKGAPFEKPRSAKGGLKLCPTCTGQNLEPVMVGPNGEIMAQPMPEAGPAQGRCTSQNCPDGRAGTVRAWGDGTCVRCCSELTAA